MKIKQTISPFMESVNVYLRRLLIVAVGLLTITVASAQAQTKTITGKVVDETKEPITGATVRIKGTTTGTITDIEGLYSLQTKAGDVLEFSFMGMEPQEITVGSSNQINVVMKDHSIMLTEAVVIGYGSAKAKDLTSPIATIKADDISKQVTASPMQGLQGKIAGLQVVNSGEPGKSPDIRIRGFGSMQEDKGGPLFVVDGMFFDNIDFLGNGDIENISILKDASACAIYGVRAANGVVIVTTKKGIPNRKPQIVYDGYVGLQQASNIMKMANTGQYVTMMREMAVGKTQEEQSAILRSITLSEQLYGGTNGMPSTNTDWYSELTKVAPVQNHSIIVTGGAEKTTYSISGSYFGQEGIARMADTGFERFTLRAKVDAALTDWFKIGTNIGVVNSSQLKGNNSAWGNAFVSPSMMPVYDPKNKTPKNPDGFASPQSLELKEFFWNPLGIAKYHHEKVNGVKVLPSVYAELSFLENKLTFRTSFTQSIGFDQTTIYKPEYIISTGQKQTPSKLEKKSYKENNWILDNILTYRETFGKNSMTGMIGNSFRRDGNNWMKLWATNVPGGKEEYWYIKQGNEYFPGIKPADKDATWPDDGLSYRGTSFFGRIMYDYDGKYLLSATFRADGSTKFQDNKWGYFPSIGAGWVISEEGFMKNQRVFDFLKIRGSWGRLGNDNIEMPPPFLLNSTIGGALVDQPITGTTAVGFPSKLKWEVVDEIDFGIDFYTLNNRLSVELDYYKRTTKEAIFKTKVRLLDYDIIANAGEIDNSGFEASLNWNDKLTKDFAYNVGFNITTLKNKVTKLDGAERIIRPGDYDRIDQIGSPTSAYYGYVVDGIYQTEDEIKNDKTIDHINPEAGSYPKVGYFKYKDVNGDGVLTSDDRKIIGSHIPTLYLGGNIGFAVKQWDFNCTFQGQFGHKLINMKRFLRQKQNDMNFDANLVENRWTGEGSTNKYPSAQAWESGWNYKFNTFYTESGSTFTIQNVQLGYTFDNIFPSSANKSSLRLSLTAQRPLNFFSYNGFTTEFSNGVDHTAYPMVSTYTFGAKLAF